MRFILNAFWLLSVCFSVQAFSQVLPFPHVVTSGYGEVTVAPDSATFSVQVEKTMMNASKAKSSVDEVVDTFLKELIKMGVKKEEITSSNIYLAPQYYYPKVGKAELVGYKARRKVTVTVNQLNKLNSYIDTAIKSGIDRVENIELKVKNNQKYIEQARTIAINDAIQKARFLAKGFDRSLGEVWQITYRNNSSAPVMMRTFSAKEKMTNDSYQDATIVIRDSVDVVYKLD